jgi:superfamily II DNA/RNA helicase
VFAPNLEYFVPIDFSSLGVREDLAKRLRELGIHEPYPIQSATLPETLSGRDLFAQSPTGSGKTLAFAIPLAARVTKSESRRPRGLVLAPTRELAAQIAEVIRPLAKVTGRRVASFYGGTGYRDQLTALERGVDIVVGCPGRLVDLLERGSLDLRAVDVLVIDEADRMADMGFLPPVRHLLRRIEGPRQTMLFAATVSRDVERLVEEFQDDPARHLLPVATDDLGTRTHEFWCVARDERTAVTAQLVATLGSSIVFCRTKHGADRLVRQLTREGIMAVAIHGDRSQSQRDRALAQFRGRRAQVLVGTDVAARGLHVDGVNCVVHFDPPSDDDTYLHRSGRTGRAGASGRVVSLVGPEDERLVRSFQRRFGAGARFSRPPAFAPIASHREGIQTVNDLASGPGSNRTRAPGRRIPRRSGAQAVEAAAQRRRRPRPPAKRASAPAQRVASSSKRPYRPS